MTVEDVFRLLKANIGRVARVTPVDGEPELLLIKSVGQEGFTYHLLGPGQDRKITHWWPADEVVQIEGPLEMPDNDSSEGEQSGDGRIKQ